MAEQRREELVEEPSAVVWSWKSGAMISEVAGVAGSSGVPGGSGAAARDRAAQAAAARRQGWIGGAIGGAAAAVFAFLLHRRGLAIAVASLSLLVTATALAAPLTLFRRLSRLFELLGHAVGTAVTWVLMTVLFYLLFLPVGLLLRATGKLGFTRFADSRLRSYWVTKEGGPHAAESYRKQF
ncbi:MAG TPA: hypothetical protein VHR45_06210 [Thermoanaerobaculia bacterium]|nr:hypothetical protein [Thermoanaerobaculia bacterium]